MTEKPNILILRFHKKRIIKEDENTILVKIDDARGFLEQLIMGFANPNMAIVNEDEE